MGSRPGRQSRCEWLATGDGKRECMVADVMSSHSWMTCGWSRIRRCGEGTNCGLLSGYGGVGVWTGGGWCSRRRAELGEGFTELMQVSRVLPAANGLRGCSLQVMPSQWRTVIQDGSLIQSHLVLVLVACIVAVAVAGRKSKCMRIPVSFDVTRTRLHLAGRGKYWWESVKRDSIRLVQIG